MLGTRLTWLRSAAPGAFAFVLILGTGTCAPEGAAPDGGSAAVVSFNDAWRYPSGHTTGLGPRTAWWSVPTCTPVK